MWVIANCKMKKYLLIKHVIYKDNEFHINYEAKHFCNTTPKTATKPFYCANFNYFFLRTNLIQQNRVKKTFFFYDDDKQ